MTSERNHSTTSTITDDRSNIMNSPELTKGTEGEWVEYLQRLLQQLGYGAGSTGAVFDDQLEEAVRRFQHDVGLDASGIVDADTWARMEGGGEVCVAQMAINQSVQLVAQPTDVTCWAASIAMLTGKTVDDVVDEAGMTTTDGYGWGDIQRAVSAHGLNEIGPACGGPDYFARYLERSPLWIVEVGAPYHAVVLAGLNGGGQWDDTMATIYNPWPPGSGVVETKTFADFAQEYELGAGAMAQIVSR
jgi:hypothetical protein